MSLRRIKGPRSTQFCAACGATVRCHSFLSLLDDETFKHEAAKLDAVLTEEIEITNIRYIHFRCPKGHEWTVGKGDAPTTH